MKQIEVSRSCFHTGNEGAEVGPSSSLPHPSPSATHLCPLAVERHTHLQQVPESKECGKPHIYRAYVCLIHKHKKREAKASDALRKEPCQHYTIL